MGRVGVGTGGWLVMLLVTLLVPAAGCDPAARRYCPSAPVSRAEVATFLIRALGESAAGTYHGLFSDVPAGQWYTAAVEWAASLGITSGYTDGSFRPGAPVTRAEVSALLLRALGQDADLTAPVGVFDAVPADACSPPSRTAAPQRIHLGLWQQSLLSACPGAAG
jgi:hypothetical protein